MCFRSPSEPSFQIVGAFCHFRKVAVAATNSCQLWWLKIRFIVPWRNRKFRRLKFRRENPVNIHRFNWSIPLLEPISSESVWFFFPGQDLTNLVLELHCVCAHSGGCKYIMNPPFFRRGVSVKTVVQGNTFSVLNGLDPRNRRWMMWCICDRLEAFLQIAFMNRVIYRQKNWNICIVHERTFKRLVEPFAKSSYLVKNFWPIANWRKPHPNIANRYLSRVVRCPNSCSILRRFQRVVFFVLVRAWWWRRRQLPIPPAERFQCLWLIVRTKVLGVDWWKKWEEENHIWMHSIKTNLTILSLKGPFCLFDVISSAGPIARSGPRAHCRCCTPWPTVPHDSDSEGADAVVRYPRPWPADMTVARVTERAPGHGPGRRSQPLFA